MDWRIRFAIAIIRRDLARPLSVSALAARVNLSRSRFTHLFCAELGVGPGRFLRQARLEHAAQLLVDTTLSIKEIMAAVGLNDPSHFARDFKQQHGLSPRGYRARARSPGRARGASRHARAAQTAQR